MLNAFVSQMRQAHASASSKLRRVSSVEQRKPSCADHNEIFEWQNVRGRLWVTGCKTPSEYMFSELPPTADIVRNAFHHFANPLVLQITAFWVRAILG